MIQESSSAYSHGLCCLHNIFPDQVKKIWHMISATKLSYFSTSPYCVTSRSWQVHISCSNLSCLYSFSYLLHVTIFSPLKESRSRRDKNQEKNLRRNVMNRVLFLAYISIMTTKNCLAQINPQFECFLYQDHVRRIK